MLSTEIAFWFCLAILVYAFPGYPILLAVLTKVRSKPVRVGGAGSSGRTVTVVLIAHNEENRIVPRIQNLLDTSFPGPLQVVVVTDGCTDGTVTQTRLLNEPRILVQERATRSGKAACLNAALAAATGEIIVFADARQRYTRETIPNLVMNFTDPEVGAVSGDYSVDVSKSSIGGGVDAYWKLEKFIRRSESALDSSIGCTGAVYAIRRELYRPLPEDTILDDVVTPMEIALQGRRVVFEPRATCVDPQTLDPVTERTRKRRTLAGNFQMLFRYPTWLLPFRNRVWWQLISHKYLRLIAPVMMAVLFICNLQLRSEPLYRELFIGQCAFYVTAFVGMILPVRTAVLSIPAGFVFLNWMTVLGLVHYLTKSPSAGWASASGASVPTAKTRKTATEPHGG